MPFAAVGTHDTASAVAAIPRRGKFCVLLQRNLVALRCGNGKAAGQTIRRLRANFSNEGHGTGRVPSSEEYHGAVDHAGMPPRLGASGYGLHLEGNRRADREGGAVCRVYRSRRRAVFSPRAICAKRLRAIAKKTGAEKRRRRAGEFARCVYESLALKYRWTLERLEKLKGGRIDTLNITGGGIGNTLLCQMTADVLNRRVIAGPAEGSAMGNTLMQAVALGEIKDISEARQVARRSVEPIVYEPRHTQQWEDALCKNCSAIWR